MDLPLATVSNVLEDEKWKNKIGDWDIVKLADGWCDGKGYGFKVRKGNRDGLEQKMVVEPTEIFIAK